jgi:thymidylate kinase
MVVICDRYPQCQVMGFNDGPLLSRWLEHHNRLLRYLANWELTPYQWSEIYSPDLVIKLLVTPQVALSRTHDGMSLEAIRIKGKAIEQLKYSTPTEVISVDADKSVDQVIKEVKSLVWEKI